LPAGCGGGREFQDLESKKPRKKVESKKDESDDDAKGDDAKDDDGKDGKAADATTATPEAAVTQDSGEATDAKSAGKDLDEFDSGNGGKAAVDTILEECGGRAALDAAPDEVILQKSLTSLQITISVLTVTVRATTLLQFNVTPARTVQDSTVRIDQISSDVARGTADRLAQENSGRVTVDNVLPKDIGSLGDTHKAWKGTRCTFVPATRLINERGGKRTVVSFDPPFPMTLSPTVAAKRYEEEIGAERIFDGLKVNVEETNQAALSGKTSVVGRVVVTRISPAASFDDGKGGRVSLNADIAYRVRSEFETPETTFLLGLPPEVDYYISYDRKDLLANLVDTKAANTGPAIFIHPAMQKQ
jgi:hypothetical protein